MVNKANKIIAILIWIIASLLLIQQSDPFYWFLFFIPFALFPHGVNQALIYTLTTTKAQKALLVGQLVYFIWFTYVYIDAFYINLDPQSAIVLLFVGVFSLPVMVVIWVMALSFNDKV